LLFFYFIAAPSVFYWGFNLVKPLMTKHTLSKIEIFDDNKYKWLEAINSFLPASAIPKKLGGAAEMKSFY